MLSDYKHDFPLHMFSSVYGSVILPVLANILDVPESSAGLVSG